MTLRASLATMFAASCLAAILVSETAAAQEPAGPPLPNVKAPQPHCRPNMLGEWFSLIDGIHERFGSLTITPDALIFGRLGRFGFTRRTTPGGHPYLELDRTLVIPKYIAPNKNFMFPGYPGTVENPAGERCEVDVVMCRDRAEMAIWFDESPSASACSWFEFSQPGTGAIN